MDGQRCITLPLEVLNSVRKLLNSFTVSKCHKLRVGVILSMNKRRQLIEYVLGLFWLIEMFWKSVIEPSNYTWILLHLNGLNFGCF